MTDWWQRLSNPGRSIKDVWNERQWKNEYDRVLPLLKRAYESSAVAEQERLGHAEEAFFAGDRAAFVSWAQSVVPGSFSSLTEVRTREGIRLPTSPGAEAVEPLPDWWPKQRAYHGTRAAYEVLLDQGLCAPGAVNASGDDYGWKDVWRDEVWHSYTNHLDGAQKRRFRDQSGLAGRRPSKDAIGEVVALFWVTKRLQTAASHGDVLDVNLAALRYYWWFPDNVLGESSYVFVMPVDCPQALPAAFSMSTR